MGEKTNYRENIPTENLNFNLTDTSKFEMVYALFNQYLFQEAKNNIELIDYYFQTDYTTSGNALVGELINSIRNYSLESLDLPLFEGILLKLGKDKDEKELILDKIKKWKSYSKDQIKPYRDTLRQIFYDALTRRARSLYGNDPSKYVEYLRNFQLKLESSEVLSTIPFNQIDINTIVADNGMIIRTGIDILDGSFGDRGSVYYGVPDHQAILVCCPPGTGKTMFMMNMMLNIVTDPLNVDPSGNPIKCHYLAMGDMMPSDFIVRLGSIATGLSMRVTKTNPRQAFSTLSDMVGDRIELSVIPSAKLTVDEYIDEMKRSDAKVCFIDYDSNFKNNAGDNMYLEYGALYDKLTELTQMGKLVVIAAQPKVKSWDCKKAETDVIEMDMVGESARKIHSVDMALTGSRATDFGNSGIFKLVKNRRGDAGTALGYIRLNNGRFKFVDRQVFQSLRNTDTRNWSESQVDDAMANFEATKNSLNMTGFGMNLKSGGSSTMKNPF